MNRTVVAPGQPAAGSGFTYLLPESEVSQLYAVTFRLVTSATVATRVPTVTVTDGTGTPLAVIAAGKTQVASLTGDWTFAVGLGAWDAASTAVLSGGLPALPLGAGDSIVVGVNAIDTTDQLSRIRIVLLQESVRPDDGG